MISNLQLVLALKLSMSREVASGDWPDATQGENAINFNLAGVDLSVWNDAYVAKLAIAAGSTTTVDLRDFETLLFEDNVALDAVFGMALLVESADAEALDGVLTVRPGATNPLEWFFEGTDGLVVLPGQVSVPAFYNPAEADGFAVDATHRNLDFENTGTDDIVVTVIIIGGR